AGRLYQLEICGAASATGRQADSGRCRRLPAGHALYYGSGVLAGDWRNEPADDAALYGRYNIKAAYGDSGKVGRQLVGRYHGLTLGKGNREALGQVFRTMEEQNRQPPLGGE